MEQFWPNFENFQNFAQSVHWTILANLAKNLTKI